MDINTSKYIDSWKLSEPMQIAQTFTGNLYKVDSSYGKAVLKIFTEVGMKDEIGGTDFLKNTQGKGSVRSFESDERAQLLEFLPGPNLYEFSINGEEEKATDFFIKIIKNVSSAEIKYSDGLLPVEKLFDAFERVNYPKHLEILLTGGKELANQLTSTQTKKVLLHGDLHHENVMKAKNDDFVCFDPKGMVGDPSYELGTTLKNPWDYPEISQNIDLYRERVEKFSVELDLPKERIIGFSFVHLCLSVLWGVEDGNDFSHQETVLKMIEPEVKKYF